MLKLSLTGGKDAAGWLAGRLVDLQLCSTSLKVATGPRPTHQEAAWDGAWDAISLSGQNSP